MDQQNVKHRQEINNADKRLFYWHELKKSNLNANQVKRLGNDETVQDNEVVPTAKLLSLNERSEFTV